MPKRNQLSNEIEALSVLLPVAIKKKLRELAAVTRPKSSMAQVAAMFIMEGIERWEESQGEGKI